MVRVEQEESTFWFQRSLFVVAKKKKEKANEILKKKKKTSTCLRQPFETISFFSETRRPANLLASLVHIALHD